MQLELESVHLRNFRIHADYTFKPASTGVTAIVGKSGHGKSTITDGLAWALFGTKPHSTVKSDSWRRQLAPESEPCYVDVSIKVNDQKVRIKRSIVNMSGAAQCECWLDGELVAGPAVTHAAKWISKTLGLDEDGFLSAVFVQQKQLETIVSASPTERRTILEKLTGITAVTKAMDLAHDEERGYAKVVGALRTDDTKLPSLEQSITKLTKHMADLESESADISARMAKAKQDGVAARERFDVLDDQHTKLESSRARFDTIDKEYSMLSDRQSELMDKQKELKAGLPSTPVDSATIAKLESDLDALAARRSQAASIVNDCRRLVAARPTADELADLESKAKSAAEAANADDGEALTAEHDRVKSEHAVATSQRRQYEKSLKAFESGDVGICPTCLQPIKDLGHIRKSLDDTRTRERDAESSMKSLENRIAEHETAVSASADAVAALTDARERERAGADADERLVDADAELQTVKAEEKAVRRTLSGVDSDRVKQRNYDDVIAEFDRVARRLSSVAASRSALSKEIKEVGAGFTDARLERARKAIDKARASYNELELRSIKMDGERGLTEEKLDRAVETKKSIEEQVEQKRGMLRKLEVATGSTSVLSGFRQYMILNSIPQITDYASDLITKITDGAFTQIDIDSKFNMSVTTGDGVARGVGLLSGGERDVVALCMRLAISTLLSGGSPSLIILDEPVTAQDDERTEAALAAIRDMRIGQTIIIAHNEIVKSIADNVVEL